MTAEEIIAHLSLQPHPEGGHYRQSWVAAGAGRPAGTCIYFLLKAGEKSHWHHVDATEIWHYYAGAPAVISVSKTDSGPRRDLILGPNLFDNQQPQIIVPPHYWQSTISTGEYTLVGCTVSPAFMFEGFILADADFDIPLIGANNTVRNGKD